MAENKNPTRVAGAVDETGTPLVLRDFLFEQGVTQTEAAYRIGVTVSTLSKWERHIASPNAEHLAMIELVFGVPDARALFPRVWPQLAPAKYLANETEK